MAGETFDPWGSELLSDYEHLFSEFGMQRVDEKVLRRVLNANRLWRRGIVFAHRDFDKWLSAFERKEGVACMSGIKPSSEFHLGSKLTAEEMIFFQKEFNAKVFYSIADLECYADNGIPLAESAKTAVSNLADMLALGLSEKNCFVWKQSEEKRVMNLAYVFARKTTMNTLKALYGERNIGLYFSVLTQAGDILLPQLQDFGGAKNVVVPVGVDQDPHIRFTRDIAAKFEAEYGFKLPAATFHKFFRSLSGESKMSKRDALGVITLSDDADSLKKKVSRAFTGGRATVEEQKRLGGEWKKCVVYELCLFHFEEDDKELEERQRRCASGEISCGECKKEVIEKIQKWMKAHQEKKKKLVPKAEKMLAGD
ncbi:tryptophan--tRNA ligase [Candidatus Micrarchaeota archaeon]|nr:tryptophan--tRNA ligase [Candidatus Micrarchaeota archaeon]